MMFQQHGVKAKVVVDDDESVLWGVWQGWDMGLPHYNQASKTPLDKMDLSKLANGCCSADERCPMRRFLTKDSHGCMVGMGIGML